MTSRFQIVKSELSKLGIAIRRDAFESEIRVNFKNGLEKTAYYTDDLEDAFQTGIQMSKGGK